MKLVDISELECLKRSLQEVPDFVVKNYPQSKDWRYKSFHEAILEHGISRELKRRPVKVKPGIPRYCYQNCQRSVLEDSSLIYVEGCAIADNLSFMAPVNHAWLLDTSDGKFVDPTWDLIGSSYLGVAFKTDWLKSVWDARYQKDVEYDLTVFLGNYMDDFRLVEDGFPSGALFEF